MNGSDRDMRGTDRTIAVFLICMGSLLLEPIANAQGPAASGRAALFAAAETGDVNAIKQALNQGIAVDAPDPEGWTALMVAASAGKLAAVQALLQAGANVNVRSKSGETPLMAAALSGSAAIAQLLLKRGADRTATTTQGLTAAEIARRSNHAAVGKLLATGPAQPQIQQSPTDSEFARKFDAAEAALDAGRDDEAVQLFQEVVKLDPRHVQSWYQLAQALAKKKDFEGAVKAYEKVLELQPTGPIADRVRSLLAVLPKPRSVASLPSGMNAKVREVYLSNPLFASLPDATDPVKCTSRIRKVMENVSVYLVEDIQYVDTYTRGVGGVFKIVQDESGTRSSPPPSVERISNRTDYMSSATLGGMITNVAFFDEIEGSGSLFPLKTGNRFQFTGWHKRNDGSRFDERISCTVHEAVDVKALGVQLGADDAFRVACTFKGMPTYLQLESTQGVFLCSNSLGLCPLYWDPEAGSGVPRVSSSLTYKPYAGYAKTYQRSCVKAGG